MIDIKTNKQCGKAKLGLERRLERVRTAIKARLSPVLAAADRAGASNYAGFEYSTKCCSHHAQKVMSQ